MQGKCSQKTKATFSSHSHKMVWWRLSLIFPKYWKLLGIKQKACMKWCLCQVLWVDGHSILSPEWHDQPTWYMILEMSLGNSIAGQHSWARLQEAKCCLPKRFDSPLPRNSEVKGEISSFQAEGKVSDVSLVASRRHTFRTNDHLDKILNKRRSAIAGKEVRDTEKIE